VRTLGSSSSSGDAKLDNVWATGGQHATFFTRGKNSDPRWAALALRANDFDDHAGVARRAVYQADSGRRSSRYAAVTIDDAEPGGIDWDEVVDIVCIGRGAGVLAAAIGASRGGMTVLVADAGCGDGVSDADAPSLSGRLGVTDTETVDYLDALTQDIGPLTRCAGPGQVPMRSVHGPLRSAPGRGGIATFVGSALRDWADSCLASPCGLLHTQIARAAMTVTYTSAGKTLEAEVVGSIDVDKGKLVEGLDGWLTSHADELGIGEYSSSSLQRLVFDAGQVVGAVIDTPMGSRAIRAKHGVVLETAAASVAPTLSALQGPDLENATRVEVALVTRPASRFARLELLVTAPGR
jgi:hypothetical protein